MRNIIALSRPKEFGPSALEAETTETALAFRCCVRASDRPVHPSLQRKPFPNRKWSPILLIVNSREHRVSDPKQNQEVVPAKTEVLPAEKSSAFTLTPDGKGGVTISFGADKPKKAEDKKKMPRGSTVFRHA